VSAAGQITILIPDPDEMMFVLGQNDANIDRIEREFGVKVVSRGAELRISGEPAAVARVGELVGAMRTLSDQDENLRKPVLERLIGEAKDSPVAAPEQLRDHIATTVRGKRIQPQSLNQRSYIEAIRKYDLVFATGVAGTGKCVAENSLVLTERGMIEIGTLGSRANVGEQPPISIGVHGLDGAEQASHIYSGGESATLRITTRFGYSIETTPEHPLLVRDADGLMKWRRADALRLGDVLTLQRGQRRFGGSVAVDFTYRPIQPWGDSSRKVTLERVDEQFAYFMGVVTGDGCLTARNYVSVTSLDPEILAEFDAVAKRLGLHVYVNVDAHVIASSQLYRLLDYLGMSLGKAETKHIPWSILQSPEPVVRAFLRGLFDTDGSMDGYRNVVEFATVSAQLAREVHIALLNFGVVASRSLKRGRYAGQPHISHRLTIAGAEFERFYELVGFTLLRKCRAERLPDRNSNVDLIPYVNGALANAIHTTTLTRAEHQRLADYRRGSRRPSYPKLQEMIDLLELRNAQEISLAPLRDILHQRLLFLEIIEMSPSRSRVYDLTVPGTHSFVANGFVNHNSFLAVAMGVNALRDRKVARLILTRPAVEAGERLGFLPGDLQEKIDPYLRPLYDALYDLMPPERFTRAQERGEIEVAPLGLMRGRTLNEAFIILDEAQNATAPQMKMFLTRLGYGSQAVVTGDITQIDLAEGQRSGLVVAREILRGVEGIAFVDFNEKDVVRHELVARIVRAYERHEGEGSRG